MRRKPGHCGWRQPSGVAGGPEASRREPNCPRMLTLAARDVHSGGVVLDAPGNVLNVGGPGASAAAMPAAWQAKLVDYRVSMAQHILIADDEPYSADLLGLVLAFRGYEVTRVHDGLSALRKIRELRPELVLLDERMPGLHGSEICRAVRSDPALANCVVVLFSSVDEYDVAWSQAGASAFLQKPIDVRSLPDLVERLLSSERGPDGGEDTRAA
jgi:CheY-like chemotaxis protein